MSDDLSYVSCRLMPQPSFENAVNAVSALFLPQVDAYITSDTSYAFVVNRTNVREGGEETQHKIASC
jgi:hypothetical protein